MAWMTSSGALRFVLLLCCIVGLVGVIVLCVVIGMARSARDWKRSVHAIHLC